jgi:glycosyltransferase involved in cell wall biosynthesis
MHNTDFGDDAPQRIAFYHPSLECGGAERVTVMLVNGFAERGYLVDLVLVSSEGPFRKEIAAAVNVVDLKARGVIASLPALIRYLRSHRPVVLISAAEHSNVVAVLARQLASVKMRVIVSQHTNLSMSRVNANSLRDRLLRFFIRYAYPRANGIVAVSGGVADDLIKSIGLSPSSVRVVYNPVVNQTLHASSLKDPEHPWLRKKESPLILAVGRLTAPKDFPTLLQAFARLRRIRAVRLLILGEGELRPQLTALVAELGLQNDVDLPGFTDNPFAVMRHASLFVLSSAWEGLPTVLIEAMACGTKVVSTDCPSGPSEILEGGRWGRLVPVGDIEALAAAMGAALDDKNPPDVASRAAEFNVDAAVDGYLSVMLQNRK